MDAKVSRTHPESEDRPVDLVHDPTSSMPHSLGRSSSCQLCSIVSCTIFSTSLFCTV